MKTARIRVVVASPDTDETRRRGESPRQMVRRLAQEKAQSVAVWAGERYSNAVIIAADTTVVAPDGKKVLGKPRSRDEAVRMLSSLAGETHTVLTGYCVLNVEFGNVANLRSKNADITTRVVSSKVKMRKLSRQIIERYVESGEPMDKAGAYAAQGIGMNFIDSISGSYTNVVGLPMSQLLSDLECDFGIQILGTVKK